MLRFQLLCEGLESVLEEDQDPVGINELTQTVKRSRENEGIIFEIVLEVSFIKKYRRFLMDAFTTRGGLDADVSALVYSRNPNTRRWKLYGNTKVNYNKYDILEDRVTVNLDQIGFQRRVLNLIDRSIDLEITESENGTALPDQTTYDILYHSKTIIKTTKALPAQDDGYGEFPQEDVFKFTVPGSPTTSVDRDRMILGNVATLNLKQDELTDFFQLPFGWSDFGFGMGVYSPQTADQVKTWLSLPENSVPRFALYTAKEAGIIDIDINLILKHRILAINASGDINACLFYPLALIEIYYWVEIRDVSNNIVYLQNIGSYDMTGPCTDNREGVFETKHYVDSGVAIGVGYSVYVYSTTRVFGAYSNTGIGSDEVTHNFYITPQIGSYISITNSTKFAPSTAKTILIYEAVKRCCQYYTNKTDCFKSNLLGRTDLGYAEDGEFALIGITNGRNLRGNDRQIFSSLQDLIDFLNSVACVGFGFDTLDDGSSVLVLEKREYFYKKGLQILDLGKVPNVKRTLDSKRFYNQVNYGYETKVDIGQVNALDEFNTKRSSSIPVVNTKNALKISTKMITGGYQIEAQRRLSTTTEDGKLDDVNFAIKMIRNVSPGFQPMKNEGYAFVNNVIDPATAYNLDLSPARVLRNWYPFIASSLVYQERKEISFISGEVNFIMTSKKTVESFTVVENGTVDLSQVEAIFTGFRIILEDVPTDRDMFSLIKANGTGFVKFSDAFGNTFKGFISDTGIEHDDNKGTASYDLLEVFEP